ncbi:thialysine N-epsilon-acetyltransferase-like [Anolis sagrei]|uniref:thialysine N-epsilon-acetyltransferase-like n=1 Tax=Anolis sagrei TaxID=38937 RepID=UPI003520D6AC
MMNCIIRPWAVRDLKEVMRLIRESAAFHKALDQVTTTTKNFQEDGFGKEPTFGCLVAELPPGEKTKGGHTIIGYQFHYLSYCTWDGPVLFGEDLYVMPEYRGKGIGTTLVNKVCQVALEKGCSQFRFISAQWNQPAMDFYTKLGAVNVTIKDHWLVHNITGQNIQKLAEQAKQLRSG